MNVWANKMWYRMEYYSVIKKESNSAMYYNMKGR